MPIGVHHDIQPHVARITGAQLAEGHQQILKGLPAAALAHQTIVVDVGEPEELFSPLGPMGGGPLAPRMAPAGQSDTRDRTQFQRPPFVEADHRSASGLALIEAEDARFFFASNAGSGDCFHVLSRCGVMPSRRNTRRTHSSVIAGSNPRALQYAANLAVDHSVKGSPKSTGRLRATVTNARTWAVVRIGSRPLGLGGRSNVSMPEVLNRCTHT
jgi:hypothetical protein